ncbi:MAG: TrkH family potassium uptake protein [Deltaproteobacteria bacterium]|nr:TrkH family potassium uptake protein [Deltaproteobacteria bacterium]MBW2386405.1 TrkH family potassium uptake protein [Deltaproteobacteria bacterium]
MNILLATQLAGWLLVLIGGFQLLPAIAALAFDEPMAPYLVSAGVSLLLGLPVALGVRPQNLRVRPRDGFFIVSSAWLLASVFGALPYITTGTLSPVDALFESVAGFTTTGSTVLVAIEETPRALLLWRSLTQWLGGMGIVVFTIALMPILGIGGMQLFKAEVPGPVTEKIRPRVAETARRLWLIYVGLTSAEWAALMIAGMPGFDALCHSLTTLSTGGFSTRSASIGAYGSAAVDWVVIVFMLLAGINFVLHYRVITGRGRAVLQDSELRYFLVVVAVAIVFVVLGTWQAPGGDGPRPLFREVVFNVISIVTTTGYATADFERWSSLSHLVLLSLMILGAMAGSTSGGVKSLRAVLALRAMRNVFSTAGHRNAVQPPVHYGGKSVPDDIVASIWVFLGVYFLLVGLMAVVVAAAGYDLVTAISGGVTAVGNVGPGLGEIGPFDHFAHFPTTVKLCFALCMIAGRLELFTLLVLLSPGFWRR